MIPIHKRPETTFCLNEKFWYPEGQSSTWAVIQGTMSHPFLLFFFTINVKERGMKISRRQRGVNSKGKIEEGFRPRRKFVTGAFSQEKRDNFYSRVRHPWQLPASKQ